ncbi:MAG TPA: hypothetical protein VGW78_04285 [Candidatus Babeliales bacterium]|nr:hypothetical protein [Candidatus Babeliales bacterium]
MNRVSHFFIVCLLITTYTLVADEPTKQEMSDKQSVKEVACEDISIGEDTVEDTTNQISTDIYGFWYLDIISCVCFREIIEIIAKAILPKDAGYVFWPTRNALIIVAKEQDRLNLVNIIKWIDAVNIIEGYDIHSSPYDQEIAALRTIICELQKQIEVDKAILRDLELAYNKEVDPESANKSCNIKKDWEKQDQLIKKREKECAVIEYALAEYIAKSDTNKEVV